MRDLSSQSAALYRIAPFALFVALLAARGELEDLDAVDSRWFYAVQAGATAVLLLLLRRHFGELSRAHCGFPALLLAAAAGLGVFVLWINLTAPWMRLGEPVARFDPTTAEGQLEWGLIAIRTLGAVLVVPLMEELFWRSFLMRWLQRHDFAGVDPRTVGVFGIVGSSAVFALAHNLWLAGFVAGVVYALLYARTRCLWCAVVAHATTNLALAAWVVSSRQWAFW